MCHLFSKSPSAIVLTLLLLTVVFAGTALAAGSPPVFSDVPTQHGDEGQHLATYVNATDPDNDTLILWAAELPWGANFTDLGNGTGLLQWTPRDNQSGAHTARIHAADDTFTANTTVHYEIANTIDEAPIFEHIPDRSGAEWQWLETYVNASDPEGEPVTLEADRLPGNATFDDLGGGTGRILWWPAANQSGTHEASILAHDGTRTNNTTITFHIEDSVNRAPLITDLPTQHADEGAYTRINVSAADLDHDPLTLIALALPQGATFTDAGNGTGYVAWTPGDNQSGTHHAVIQAADHALHDNTTIEIIVQNTLNTPPDIEDLPDQDATEGIWSNFWINATDAEGDPLDMTASDVPWGASFHDLGDGTGGFEWRPAANQSGVYHVTFRASDGLAEDTTVVQITVHEALNAAPLLDPIGDQEAEEGALLNLTIHASDPDGDPLTLEAAPLPYGASFFDHGNGTGWFMWEPAANQSGLYNVTFHAADGTAGDDETISIVVADTINHAPIAVPMEPIHGEEESSLLVHTNATDPDGDAITTRMEPLPDGATYDDHGDGRGALSWTPRANQGGSYEIDLIASDGRLENRTTITLIIADSFETPPSVHPIADQRVATGHTLRVQVEASDWEDDAISLTFHEVPQHGAFTDHGNGTGTFEWTPDANQTGWWDFEVRATANGATNNTTFLVEVVPNEAPRIWVADETAAYANDTVSVDVHITDPEGDPISTHIAPMPLDASYVRVNDTSWRFSWPTSFADLGSSEFTAYASDGARDANATFVVRILDIQASIVLERHANETRAVPRGETHFLWTIHNDGLHTERLHLSVDGEPEGWPTTLSQTNLTLAPGASAQVNVTIDVSPYQYEENLTLVVTNLSLTWTGAMHVRIPIDVHVDVTRATPLHPVVGTIEARYIDGSPANILWFVYERLESGGSTRVTTAWTPNGTGEFMFPVNSLGSNAAGDHIVWGSYQAEDHEYRSNTDRYTIRSVT